MVALCNGERLSKNPFYHFFSSTRKIRMKLRVNHKLLALCVLYSYFNFSHLDNKIKLIKILF
jgi:hypothetical protein